MNLSSLFRRLFLTQKSLKNRNFSKQLLVDKQAHDYFVQNGFVVLKNILLEDEIHKLKSIYEESKINAGFEKVDYFINTIGFEDSEIRSKLKSETDKILLSILSRIYNIENTFFPLGGGFANNPAKATRGCVPHQDPTFVDEDVNYSLTTWICLDTSTQENGCLYIIPKSHLWGNSYRSICMPWLFNDCVDELWSYMIPIEVNAGDVICFDVSIIHASKENLSTKDRLAMTVQALPKDVSLLSYYPKGNYLVEEFIIDGDYFVKDSQYQKPSSRYKRNRLLLAEKKFTPSDIQHLINSSK